MQIIWWKGTRIKLDYIESYRDLARRLEGSMNETLVVNQQNGLHFIERY